MLPFGPFHRKGYIPCIQQGTRRDISNTRHTADATHIEKYVRHVKLPFRIEHSRAKAIHTI